MSVKIILTDLDGTLLAGGQVAISERNMAALKNASDKGIYIVPCTGRSVDMLPPQLLSADYVRYVVSGHGARVYDRKQATTLYSDTFTPEESFEILNIIEGNGIFAEISANARIYIEKAVADNLSAYPIPKHHTWYMYDNRYVTVKNMAKHFLDNGIGIEKVNIYGMPADKQQRIFEQLNKLSFVKFTSAQAAADLEFYRYTLDKTKAVDALLDKLGIDKQDVFAIGDSKTDYDVLCQVGISVAMGNAIEDVKKIAKYVTDTNTNDGVGKAIEQYALNSNDTKELQNLDTFRPKNKLLVCIDSDGCAVDTMEIKQKECFATALIECFGLQGIAKYAREAWDFANLYSKTRGFYRMKTLLITMELLSKRREVAERGFKLPDMSPIRHWVDTYEVLSDATLREYAKTHNDDIIQTTLEWSAEVNRRVKRIVKNVPPFPFVRESLEKLQGKADIVVVSATPTAALMKEWTEHDIKKYTAFVCGQEYGSKKDIIGNLGKHYSDGKVIMLGDALGDFKAATDANAAFYPICPNIEDKSWKEFYETVADLFVGGKYTTDVQKKYVSQLDSSLAENPDWDEI